MTRDHDLELDRLASALRAAPASDPAAKAAALSRALKAFDDSALARQGAAAPLRPISGRPQRAGFLTGVRKMLNHLSMKPFLAATTSAAALAVALVVVLPQDQGLRTPAQAPLSSAPASSAPASPAADPAAAPWPDADLPVTALAPAPQEIAENADATTTRRMAVPAMADEALMMPTPMAEPTAVGGAAPRMERAPSSSDEVFANAPANPVKQTAEAPVSTFSIDVDTASYAYVRSSLMAGALPDPSAVRIEEMVNYFPYDYPAPAEGEPPFRPTVSVMQTPWNPDTRLVHIALQGRLPEVASRPPLNLVLLIDTSGSMEDADKLPLLRQSLSLMLGELRPEDQVAIVAYAGSAGEVLPPTPAADRAAILGALDRLTAGGSTAGGEGLELAYRTATAMSRLGEVSRILLATDGDFNLGLSDPEALSDYVAQQRQSGVFLSVLGFGRGNLDDAVMQALAQTGNGTAAYIDTLQEARKVLVDQLSGALFPIANDVKVQVEWNPAEVAEYRLIGYETRALAQEAFNNDAVDAGEIGAGHAVTAIYEVTAPGSPALLHEPLRYGAADSAAAAAENPDRDTAPELGFLRLRYKAPGEAISALIETPILADAAATNAAQATEASFASAIAGFGQLLHGSVYLGDWGWTDAIALADANRGDDRFGYRIEAINLMRLAQALAR